MNRTINSLLFTTALLLCTTTLFSQAADLFAKEQLVLRFEPGVSQADQQIILDRYHLVVLDGPTPISNFLLCEIDNFGFPPLPPGSYNNSPDSINGVIVSMDDNETDVDGVGNQYNGGIPVLQDGKLSTTSLPGLLKSCEGAFSIDTPEMGPRQVPVGINDSGISGVTVGSTFVMDHDVLFSSYFDDFHIGADFVGLNPLTFPEDENGHGTHMTSILVNNLNSANAGGNLDLKVKSYRTHDAAGVGTTFDIIEGIDQAVLDKVEVYNMSFSYTASFNHREDESPLKVAIEEAVTAQNMLIICAAGNKAFDNDDAQGYASYPASFDIPNIVSVASVNCSHQMSNFSSYGGYSVDLAAFGERIPGAWLDGDFFLLSGTSPATAMVTRVANMLASHQTVFDYKPIKCALINGALPNFELAGLVVANGHLDALGAYNYFVNNPECESNGGGGSGGPEKRLAAPAIENTVDFGLTAWTGTNEVKLNFNAQFGQTAQLTVYNLLGQQLFADQIISEEGTNQYTLEASGLSQSKMYIVQLMIDGRKETVKVIR